MGDMLIAENAITEEQLGEALRGAKEDHLKLGEELIKLGYVTADQIAEALSKQLRIARYTPDMRINEKLLSQIPRENMDILRKYSMLPVDYAPDNMNMAIVAMTDPMDMHAADEFTIITGLQVTPVIATKLQIDSLLDRYNSGAERERAVSRFLEERRSEFGDDTEEQDADSRVDDSPIVILVRSMIQQAARQRASDIHIEALEHEVRVRFRIDGVLYEKFRYDAQMAPAIIARIKILGKMDISEKRKPQDGRLTMMVDHTEYDIRVSILPTVYGEKCVMRLAQKKALTKSKADLGMQEDDLLKFNRLLKNPNGILLVTGPTGSGKSTTLYTVLSELNHDDVNIITVEDPVEANIPGVNQVQVNPRAELTFASALRSILRQDPDIIMIGEIRDSETAQIAVRASITGHLVLSTLHTNSAAATIARLVDMGIESYLLADSVFGIIAQRLVRRLCPDCKQEDAATDEEKRLLDQPVDRPLKIYRKCGCEKCGGTGYKGRIGVYEIMTVTPKLRNLIAENANADIIEAEALKEGMVTLAGNSKRLVLDGTTTMEEMMRISFENQ